MILWRFLQHFTAGKLIFDSFFSLFTFFLFLLNKIFTKIKMITSCNETGNLLWDSWNEIWIQKKTKDCSVHFISSRFCWKMQFQFFFRFLLVLLTFNLKVQNNDAYTSTMLQVITTIHRLICIWFECLLSLENC